MATRVGHVDLDTSHPANWIPIIRDLGYDVVGVYDGGTVWPEGYAQAFALQHDIPRVYGSLEDMAQDVDVAIIHSCNWDLHLERAAPFVAAGKAILIDKPMVGNLTDANQLRDWARQGARITGSSSARFAYEVQEFLSKPLQERGQPHAIFCGCGVDEFNYGIHAYSLMCGLMGSGVESVRYLGTSTQKQIELVWRDKRRGILTIGPNPSYLPFYATVVTGQSVFHIQLDGSRLYRALLEKALPYLAGTEDAPASLEELLEVELSAVAARMSWMHHGARIFMSDLRDDDPGYDGVAFAQSYRLSRLRAMSSSPVTPPLAGRDSPADGSSPARE
jgi:hypothetical protein